MEERNPKSVFFRTAVTVLIVLTGVLIPVFILPLGLFSQFTTGDMASLAVAWAAVIILGLILSFARRTYWRLYFEWITACCLSFVFAVFCSARVGYFILYFLILMMFISVLLPQLFFRDDLVIIRPSERICEKRSRFLIEVILVQSPLLRYLPRPETDTEEVFFGGIRPVGELKLEKIGKRGAVLYTREYEAVYAGGASVSVKGLKYSDFLGTGEYYRKISRVYVMTGDDRDSRALADDAAFNLLRMHRDKEVPGLVRVEDVDAILGVLPVIRTVSADSPLLKRALAGADFFGDSEDTIEETTGSFGGFPGYDHRPYMDGDPIKRINYKLSARRDELFVRLDEKQVYGSVELTLDPGVTKGLDREAADAGWEGHMEETLGLCENLLSRQFTVRLTYPSGSGSVERLLRQEGESTALLPELAFCRHEEGREV